MRDSISKTNINKFTKDFKSSSTSNITRNALVRSNINDVRLAGSHDINWDASMNASGVYFIRFNADGNMHTQKILLVK